MCRIVEAFSKRWRMTPSQTKSKVQIFNAPPARVLRVAPVRSCAAPSRCRGFVGGAAAVVVGSACRRCGLTPAAHGLEWLLDGHPMEVVDSFPYLGVDFCSDGKWSRVCKRRCAQASARLHALSLTGLARDRFSAPVGALLWGSLIRPCVEYGAEVVSPNAACRAALQKLQNDAARAILHVGKATPIDVLLGELGWVPFADRLRCASVCGTGSCACLRVAWSDASRCAASLVVTWILPLRPRRPGWLRCMPSSCALASCSGGRLPLGRACPLTSSGAWLWMLLSTSGRRSSVPVCPLSRLSTRTAL